MRILAILGLTLLLLVAGAIPALASSRQVNQLNSVANVLAAVDHQLEAVLAIPPDPWSPGAAGIIGRLNAITNQLQVQLGRVQAVLGTPPDPFTPEYRAALANVHGAAQGIVARTGSPPDPWRANSALMAALGGVEDAAQAIVNLTA